MSYSITNLRTDLENSLHGQTLNKVSGVNQIIERAASQLLLDLDPTETKRIVQMTNPVFDKVYDYVIPTDLKGSKIIDIRPQANRTILDRYSQIYGQEFDINKGFTRQPNFTIQHDGMAKTIRINNPLLEQGISINQADTISGNGVWATGDSGTNIREDNVMHVDGVGSSIEFDSTNATTTVSISNATMTALDMTEHYNQSTLLFWVYLPDSTKVTNLVLRFGSDSSNYWYSPTITTQQDGTALTTGWNFISFAWINATATGTPDKTAVNYLKLIITTDGTAMTGFRINSFFSKMGIIVECVYYSKYIFRDAITGAFQETITDNSNLINLDTETRNLLLVLTQCYAVQQIQGLDGMFFDSPWFENRYQQMLAQYKSQYKSEWVRPKSTYYRQPTSSYRKNMGNRYNY